MKHIALLIFLPLLACSDDGQGGPEQQGERNCEPFDAETGTPIELGTVLAAGRDSVGAVYVVDENEDGSELRAFSGSEMTLTQNVVSGSFGMNDGTVESFGLTVDVLPRSYLLLVEIEGDEVRMGRTFDTDLRGPAIADLSPSELLEIIDPEALEDAVVHGVRGEIQGEYLANAPSGELLLVTSRPDSADYYESFRLFYGKPEAILERELLSLRRGRDGGSTTIEFELDGRLVTASFPVEHDGTQFVPGAWSLELPGESIPLEQLSIEADAELLESANFQCLG